MNKHLYNFFADTYSVYLKTQCYHWNVTGVNFLELHKLFESQYSELAEAIDEIAERLRSLNFLVPANFEDLKNSSSISFPNEKFSSKQMIEDLIISNEKICFEAKRIIFEFSESDDFATIDLLTRRISVHEKAVWFLRSFI